MKIEFKDINDKSFSPGKVFFLYGNYKNTFNTFCDTALCSLRGKYDVSSYFCTVTECNKIADNQCDLFGENVTCFCIRNVEDNHLDKLSPYLGNPDKVFILESGDYGKSKKITEHFTKSKDCLAVASFKNNMTLLSLIKMIVPNVSPQVANQILNIINNTDEELNSLLKKISLMCEDQMDLQKYTTHKQCFWDGLDFIPLVRMLIQSAIKFKTTGKGFGDLRLGNSSGDMEFLIQAELKRKFENQLTKSYLYQKMK